MIKESEWIPGSNTRQNKTKSLIDASLINNSIFLIYWLNMGPTVHICHLYTFHHPHPLTQEADITYKNKFALVVGEKCVTMVQKYRTVNRCPL